MNGRALAQKGRRKLLSKIWKQGTPFMIDYKSPRESTSSRGGYGIKGDKKLQKGFVDAKREGLWTSVAFYGQGNGKN
jgi:hypothetical protein